MKNVSEEFLEFFQFLEEGILLIKDNQVSFLNDIFIDIINRSICHFEPNESTEDILDKKIFKVYRHINDEEESSISSEIIEEGEIFST